MPRRPRRRRPRQNRHFRIDHELKAEDLAAYRSYLGEPRTTIKSAHAWLVARGYTTFSESAVARHMRHFLEGVREQRTAEQFALRCVELRQGGKGGGDALLPATLFLAEQLVFIATRQLRGAKRVTPEQINRLAESIERVIDLRGRMQPVTEPADRERAPGSMEEIAQCVRELLSGPPGGPDPAQN